MAATRSMQAYTKNCAYATLIMLDGMTQKDARNRMKKASVEEIKAWAKAWERHVLQHKV